MKNHIQILSIALIILLAVSCQSGKSTSEGKSSPVVEKADYYAADKKVKSRERLMKSEEHMEVV